MPTIGKKQIPVEKQQKPTEAIHQLNLGTIVTSRDKNRAETGAGETKTSQKLRENVLKLRKIDKNRVKACQIIKTSPPNPRSVPVGSQGRGRKGKNSQKQAAAGTSKKINRFFQKSTKIGKTLKNSSKN